MALFALGLPLLACTKDKAKDVEHEPTHVALTQRLSYASPATATNIRIASFVAEAVVPTDATWELGPGSAGRISKWHVRIGDRVEEGSPLADISNYERSDLLSAMQEARVTFEQAEHALQRENERLRAGVGTRADVLAAEAARAQAEARMQSVRRQITARAATGTTQGDSWLSSVSGVVDDVRCAPGSVVGPETSCIRILDVSKAVIESHIPERAVATMPENISARWTPWGTVEASKELVVVRRSPSMDPLSRTQAFEFAANDGSPIEVIPGQSGRLDIFAQGAPNWLVVPSSALTRLDGDDVVFQRESEDSNSLPTPIPVTVIIRNSENAVIESEILSASSTIVTRGVFLLRGVIEGDSGSEHSH